MRKKRKKKLKDSLKIHTNSADFSESRIRILFSASLLCMALFDFFQCPPIIWCMENPPRCELCMSLAVLGTTVMMHTAQHTLLSAYLLFLSYVKAKPLCYHTKNYKTWMVCFYHEVLPPPPSIARIVHIL